MLGSKHEAVEANVQHSEDGKGRDSRDESRRRKWPYRVGRLGCGYPVV